MRNPLGKKLMRVSKPARYIGGEYGAVSKSWESVDIRWCLAFPEVYEIGMSHLGLSLIYNVLNNHEGILADRVYTPWFDMEQLLREEKVSLYGLDTGKSLTEFDIIGITIPYELTYTNILSILDLGGIPLLQKDRNEKDPIILGGGCGAFNPEPIADFFDAILIGDGEEAVIKISEAVKEGRDLSRKDLLESLSKIKGVYVPSLGVEKKIERETISNIDHKLSSDQKVVPNIQLVHDRVAVEVQRGCTRGCRFCQAGMVYRPDRQRSFDDVIKSADNGVKASGYEECALLSLSTGDYGPVKEVIKKLGKKFEKEWVHISLPSLRTDSLDDDVIKVLSRSLKGGFTLAPEAATDRLRRVINKGNKEEDLLESAEKIFESGWKNLKLYFMIGLPTETDDDIYAIGDLARKIQKIGRKHHKFPNITINVSTFVPKAHTPFQREKQISFERTEEIQEILKREIRGPGLKLKLHNRKVSLLEGIFARGDRGLSKVIFKAYQEGCRFDAWDDQLDFNKWMTILKDINIEQEAYLRERKEDETLPWDHIFSQLD